ncbi:hypothetical protein [Streptomyces sp. NPDC056061]|uniref:hypothetical protein n=1 Tax=Streptomyces sp. NPDC056061 TaxID=3345700 RepID=UPI0035D68B47
MTQSRNENETTGHGGSTLSLPPVSPYDTGERCEPKPWIPYGTPVNGAYPAEDFGKVDFDDDEGHIICVVYVERTADGQHTVHIDPQYSGDEISAVLHLPSGEVHLNGTEDHSQE